MPVFNLGDIAEELVTPQHSTALGRLITGEQVEFAILRFKAGEGANIHRHPQEQIIYVLNGPMRVTAEGRDTVIGPGQAVLFPSNVPHGTTVLDDVECVSVKGVIGGIGHKIPA